MRNFQAKSFSTATSDVMMYELFLHPHQHLVVNHFDFGRSSGYVVVPCSFNFHNGE